MQRLLFVNLLFFLMGIQFVWAETAVEVEPLPPIYARIQQLIKQNMGQNTRIKKIEIQKLGSQTRLPRCHTPVQISSTQLSNRYRISTRPTFLVQCNRPAWKVFIRTQIIAERPAVITIAPIPRHTLIRQDQITQQWLDITRIRPNVIADPKQVIGYRAKRTIGPNTPITAQMLLPPYWVQKKKPVTILTRIGEIEVRTKGIALKDAVENEVVAVKNLGSGKTVRGIVIAPNTVLVP